MRLLISNIILIAILLISCSKNSNPIVTKPATFTVSVQSTTGGSVTVIPEKSDYNYGDTVTLIAISTYNYMFSNYSGDISSTNGTVSFVVVRNATIIANFISFSNLAIGTWKGSFVAPDLYDTTMLVTWGQIISITSDHNYSRTLTIASDKYFSSTKTVYYNTGTWSVAGSNITLTDVYCEVLANSSDQSLTLITCPGTGKVTFTINVVGNQWIIPTQENGKTVNVTYTKQ
jgi:hypothetical protein